MASSKTTAKKRDVDEEMSELGIGASRGDGGGGVPHGWPGLNAARLQYGHGKAKQEL